MRIRTASTAIGVDEFARTIADIAQALESPKDADTRIAHVLTLIGTLVPNDRCAILWCAADRQMRVIQVPSAGGGSDPNLTALLESLLHFTEGDAEGHRPFQSSAHLAVPVIGCDEIIGVLLVERDTDDDFDAHHLRCLTAARHSLGVT